MVRVEVVVCDVCGVVGKPVEEYVITRQRDGVATEVALCSDDDSIATMAESITVPTLAEANQQTPPPRPGKTRRSSLRSRVSSVADIEASKHQ